MPRSSCLIPAQATLLGLALAILSVAPAPPNPPAAAPTIPSGPTPLADARFKAASKQFAEVWTFHRQSRSDSFPVYYWSKLVLESQQDLSKQKPDQIAALDAHLDRMRKLETLVKKVRRIGFGFSIDVGATEYYRLEAERWIEKAKAE